MGKKNMNLIIGSLLFLIGSVLWFISLFLQDEETIILYDKIAAALFIIGSIFFLVDLM